jgi:glycosidase
MDVRLASQKQVLSSHGDAGNYFVTFLENHDMNYRFAASCRPEQVTLALTCLFTFQGVPSLYYGMEQGMDQSGDARESARFCLWRNPGVFTQAPQHLYYQAIAQLSLLRQQQPAARYGRQYFRELTGNGTDFGYSPYPGGVLAYARVLNDQELLIVANTSQTEAVSIGVVVDRQLHAPGAKLGVLFSNLPLHGASAPSSPAPTYLANGCSVAPLVLRPMEVLVLT